MSRIRTIGRCLWAASPMLIYFAFYEGVRHIPHAWLPTVHVDTLVRWERFLFQGLPHQWLAPTMHPVLDLLAATAYQLHFYAPLIFVIMLWRRVPQMVRPFAWGYLLMNMAALATQLTFPTAPPWYFEHYGTAAANYTMVGDPAGLARVDLILGTQYFHGMYAMSSIVFGAFPSMHAAWPILIGLHARKATMPRVTIGIALYTAWMWWAAVYLQHHYVVDLLAGAAFAVAAYWVVKKTTPAPYY